MNKHLHILKELEIINDANFQMVCDQFLAYEYKGDLTSLGTVIGKQKTRKGKPDAFLKLPNGNYVLGEYTTKSTKARAAFLKKLEKDLKDCFDVEKFNLAKDQVHSIVLCYNNKLEIPEMQYLYKLAKDSGFELRHVSIDTLAIYLYRDGKTVARDFLGISFDTGQLLNKEQFLEQYHKSSLSTPLNNQLFGREAQLSSIVDSILENDIVIVSGSPGVGKSRILLKAVDDYISNHPQYMPYYVVQKNNNIADDLITSLENDKHYLLFIDDANRQIDNLLSVLFSQTEKQKGNVKIVITVRDYARGEVLIKCREFDPALIHIDKLPDETITKILRSNDFGMADSVLLDRILEISKGNPRLAIMAGRVVAKHPGLEVLKDVSNIYEEYFQSYIKDKDVFANRETLKVLGLLSFFYAMDMRGDEEKAILQLFEIPFDKFVEIVHHLEDLELLDIYFKDTVKISEQVLATYFFYKVFITDKILSFGLLLNTCFQQYQQRMRDSINGTVQSFGKESVIDQVQIELKKYWQSVKDDRTKGIVYLDLFGKFFSIQVFPFVFIEISNCKIDKTQSLDYTGMAHYHTKEGLVIRLLEPFLESKDAFELQTAVDLLIDFAGKSQYAYDISLKSLQETLIVSQDDATNNMARQRLVYDRLLQNIGTDEVHRQLFYHINAHSLLSTYYNDALYRKNAAGQWELKDCLQELRKQFWQVLIKEYDTSADIIYEKLIAYFDGILYSNDVIINFDYPYIARLIEEKLSPQLFGDCVLVQRYFQNIAAVMTANKGLIEKFNSPVYQTATLLSPSRFRGKDIHQMFTDFDQEEAHKMAEIKKSIVITNLDDFKKIYDHIKVIVAYKHCVKFDFMPVMDSLLASILDADLTLGFQVLQYYLREGNITSMYPVATYKLIFKAGKTWANKLKMLIHEFEFACQEAWIERYFYFLPSELIEPSLTEELLDFYRMKKSKTELYKGMLDKFIAIDPDLYAKLLTILVDRYLQEKQCKYKLGYQFFQSDIAFVKKNLTLCKTAYLQQCTIEQHYDPDSSEFFALFSLDNHFLSELIDWLLLEDNLSNHHKNMGRLWEAANGEELISAGIEQFMAEERFYWSDHIGSLFFINLDSNHFENAFQVMKKIVLKHKDNLKAINLMLYNARNYLKVHYSQLIEYIITINPDIDFFKKMQWNNNHFSSNGTVIWSDFKAAELRNIHATIKNLPGAKNYLLHLEHIEQKISFEEANANRERKMRFMGHPW